MHARMGTHTCTHTHIHTDKHDTQLRKAFPIRKWLVVALWCLPTGNSFPTVSKAFATGKLIYYSWVLHGNIQSISSIVFPISQSETAKAIEYFKQDYDCNISQALGAIDDTHIFTQTPEDEQKNDYYCHKQRYSIKNLDKIYRNYPC